jgi:hypothetical protein
MPVPGPGVLRQLRISRPIELPHVGAHPAFCKKLTRFECTMIPSILDPPTCKSLTLHRLGPHSTQTTQAPLLRHTETSSRPCHAQSVPPSHPLRFASTVRPVHLPIPRLLMNLKRAHIVGGPRSHSGRANGMCARASWRISWMANRTSRLWESLRRGRRWRRGGELVRLQRIR